MYPEAVFTRLRGAWGTLPLRTQMFIGFLLPLIVLGASSVLVYRMLDEALGQTEKIHTSVEVIALYNHLQKTAVDAESGERGFLITADSSFLQPYQAATREFENIIQQLRHLQPARRAELDEIENLFQQWVSDVAVPVITARKAVPFRLFDTSVEALFHLHGLLQSLEVSQAPRRTDEFDARLKEFMRTVDRSALKGQDTGQQAEWRSVLLQAEAFREDFQNYLDAGTDNSDLHLRLQGKGRRLTDLLVMLADSLHEQEIYGEQLVAAGMGKNIMDEIRTLLSRLLAEEQRAQREMASIVQRHTRQAEVVAVGLPLLSAALGLTLLLMIQLHAIRSIRNMAHAAGRIANNDLQTSVKIAGSRELAILSHSFNNMAEQLRTWRNEMRMLNALQSMLASSENEDEALAVVRRFSQRLFPGLKGSIYKISESRNVVDKATMWGYPAGHADVFAPEDCFGIRAGKPHYALSDSFEILCKHVDTAVTRASLCVPLVSRDNMLGCLQLSCENEADGEPARGSLSEHERALAVTVSEHLSLTISNLRLTEKLKSESIRDPLTGLFNRRYLEETAERELARARRAGESLAVVFADADHFKSLNDEFGHEAGDVALKKIAELLHTSVRPADIVSRYGGEELVLVFPDLSLDLTLQRADDLRERIANLDIKHLGRSIRKITISMGVAMFPQHADSVEELFRQADAALYQAKHSGRNRVVSAGSDI